jgi:hypothetical protein
MSAGSFKEIRLPRKVRILRYVCHLKRFPDSVEIAQQHDIAGDFTAG